MARRLVEARVPVVMLQFGGWDTHYYSFDALRRLLPVLDRAIHTFVTDLHERGLDKEVLVVIMGEFGRTPRLTSRAGPGRDHWPDASFALFAGAVRTGQVIGETDSRAERPKTRGLRPQNVLATIYHALGIDPKLQVPGFLRPSDVAPRRWQAHHGADQLSPGGGCIPPEGSEQLAGG